MTFYDITDGDRQLIQEALAKLRQCYIEGSYHHIVGSAIRCRDGRVFSGVNCDCIHGSCAEFITIGMAISAGERDFDTIVAVHEHAPNYVVAPCGNCRQMLFEYSPGIKVILNDDEGNLVKVGIGDLLPFAYREILV